MITLQCLIKFTVGLPDDLNFEAVHLVRYKADIFAGATQVKKDIAKFLKHEDEKVFHDPEARRVCLFSEDRGINREITKFEIIDLMKFNDLVNTLGVTVAECDLTSV